MHRCSLTGSLRWAENAQCTLVTLVADVHMHFVNR